jgi:DNA-binding MarR family transcriptional regulator
MVTDCYCTSLRAAARRMTAAYDRALAPAGITAAQLAMLRAVRAAGRLSVTELADRLELERTTTTRNVRVLSRLGLVVLEPSDRDRRLTQVALSDQGEQALEQAAPLWEAAQRDFETRMGATQAQSLRARVLAL